MTERHDKDKPPYPAEKARQGRIVLTTPLRRFIFIAGLIALILFGVFFLR